MEFSGSRTLDSYFKDPEVNTPAIVKAKFEQIVAAVEFLHSHNVFHRDLSVKNVLVTKSDQVKLIDFGLATDTEARSDHFCGTLAYFSPQMLLKQPYCPRATDIWCLGIMLYVINFGHHPFGGSTC
jgi:serine/threonine protein kinase